VVRFGLKFFAIFVAFSLGFDAVRDGPVGNVLIDSTVLRPAVTALNVFSAGESVRVVNRIIESPRAQLHILRGCEGVEMLFLVAAAVLAFPAPWRRQVSGLLIGVLICWIASVLRVVGLYYTLRYAPGVWEPVHGIVAPLFSVALAGMYFLAWSSKGTCRGLPVAAQLAG
jgi:exosortase family protein XrtM